METLQHQIQKKEKKSHVNSLNMKNLKRFVFNKRKTLKCKMNNQILDNKN